VKGPQISARTRGESPREGKFPKRGQYYGAFKVWGSLVIAPRGWWKFAATIRSLAEWEEEPEFDS